MSTSTRRPATRAAVALVACVVALLPSACGRVQTREHEVLLDGAVRTFTSAVRWGDTRTVASMLAPRDGTPPAVGADTFTGVKVTDYQVELVPVNDAEVMMSARFSYYLENTATVRRLEYRGLWWFDESRRGWRLDGPAPEFHR